MPWERKKAGATWKQLVPSAEMCCCSIWLFCCVFINCFFLWNLSEIWACRPLREPVVLLFALSGMKADCSSPSLQARHPCYIPCSCNKSNAVELWGPSEVLGRGQWHQVACSQSTWDNVAVCSCIGNSSAGSNCNMVDVCVNKYTVPYGEWGEFCS